MQYVVDYLVYVVIRLLVCVVEILPLDTCARLARWLAWLVGGVLKVRQDVVDENLRHAFPEMSAEQRHELALGMWEHLFLMGMEVVHAPRKIHDTNWRDYVSLHNADQIIRTCFLDRPTVIISGHYGNFELSGYVLALLGFPSFTIARPLDNPFLDRFINNFRERTGQFILSKMGSAGEVDRILAGGGVLALLGDQYAGRKGCWTQFFGRPASSHKAIALFSLGADAPAVFCYTRRTGAMLHHVMGSDGILDPQTAPAEMRTVPAVTQWYTSQLERTIRAVPAQYWWVHRRWKDPRPRKKHRQAA